jgi:hypothetical protein
MRRAERNKYENKAKEAVEVAKTIITDYVSTGTTQKDKQHGEKNDANEPSWCKRIRKKERPLVYGIDLNAKIGYKLLDLPVPKTPYGHGPLNYKAGSVAASSDGVSQRTGARSSAQEGVSRTRKAVVVRGKRRVTREAQYASKLAATYEKIEAALYDGKRKRRETKAKQDEIKKRVKAAAETLNRTESEVIEAIKEKEKEEILREKKKQKELRDSVHGKLTAEEGERNLLEFIDRFTTGHFFYQGKQLFFRGFQLLFVNAVIPILAPNIVGPAWAQIGPRLCAQFGWKPEDFHDILAVVAPRRFGKSIASSAIAINYLLSRAPCEIAVFSTGKRVSQFLQQKVVAILRESGYGDWIVRKLEEYIILKDPADPSGHERKISFYPASTVISIFIRLLSFFLFPHNHNTFLPSPPTPNRKVRFFSGLFFFYCIRIFVVHCQFSSQNGFFPIKDARIYAVLANARAVATVPCWFGYHVTKCIKCGFVAWKNAVQRIRVFVLFFVCNDKDVDFSFHRFRGHFCTRTRNNKRISDKMHVVLINLTKKKRLLILK